MRGMKMIVHRELRKRKYEYTRTKYSHSPEQARSGAAGKDAMDTCEISSIAYAIRVQVGCFSDNS